MEIVSPPFDSREGPISCHVQVKTLLDSSNVVYLRLSSAERLAKEVKPAFLYVFKVNDEGKAFEAFLIHLLDEPLSRILRRLRKERALGTRKVNKKKLSMVVDRDGIRLPPNGAALRTAIESQCGTDLHKYIVKKAQQLSNLGFEPPAYEASMTLHLASKTDLVDLMLGLKTNVRASDIRSYETRFGVKLSHHPLSPSGTISVTPNPIDHCTIVARAEDFRTPPTFLGDVFIPAIFGLPKEQVKVLIKSPLFSIMLAHKFWRLDINNDVVASQKFNLNMWSRFWQLLRIMAEGKGVLEISSEKGIGLSLDIRHQETSVELGSGLITSSRL